MDRGSEGIEERIRAAGMRVTPQRRAVWSAFDGETNRHLTADEVFGQARGKLPELSRATVYNTLSAFVETGLLQAVDNRGAVLYDPNPDPTHQHFRCRSCDRLYDVHVEGVEDLHVSEHREFLVERKTVLMRGLCPLCLPTETG